ncbi:MAG TPA: MoaD/ThiS family protein [Pirellulales bacterium]|jgi:molybdopterin converting factor small subunit|nr:MoaD/ThiS family protein [Pirellulales bacterium]
MLTVQIQYSAQARQAAGISQESITLAAAAVVLDLLRAISEARPALRPILWNAEGQPQSSTLLFVNDVQVRAEASPPLRSGDVLTILPPIAGG